jgi:hypothetical protein
MFGLWSAADRYVGFYVGIPIPVPLGLIGSILCLIAVAIIGLRDQKAALIAILFGLAFVAAMDQLWKYAIHPTDLFKLAAMGLLIATPLVFGLGLLLFWRKWRYS